ncbi:hypothetical protein CSKR_105377 [Clonorchis sinensis]|uniref:Uncharacterized protein n=1 Tax=Clonorchis sinensis TaxID=79923 RepID=A0A419Q7M7_CLOSI|nr:hypothetical protein CSKR_105377 [Clonorchis sinensis]
MHFGSPLVVLIVPSIHLMAKASPSDSGTSAPRPDLFCRDFPVIAPSITITKPASKRTTATHATEPIFRLPFSAVRKLTLFCAEISQKRFDGSTLRPKDPVTGNLYLRMTRNTRTSEKAKQSRCYYCKTSSQNIQTSTVDTRPQQMVHLDYKSTNQMSK